jgi:hypothetical protein
MLLDMLSFCARPKNFLCFYDMFNHFLCERDMVIGCNFFMPTM